MLDSCKIIGIYVYISFDVEILVGEYELNAFSSFLGTFTDDSATLSWIDEVDVICYSYI